MNSLRLLLCCAALATVYAATTYTKTPAGLVLSHCVHSVPSGSHLKRLDDGSLHVSHGGNFLRIIPRCDNMNGTLPVVKRSSTQPATSGLTGLKDDYDGWEGYTAFYYEKGFDSFLGDFSVPANPQVDPDVLYLFTGLQNIDWIPKVDPDPAGPFDIIQPVLQYPGDNGDYWSVKSWYVTLDVGTVASDEVPVNTGDNIFGNMTRTGAQSWFIGSTSVLTGGTTNITVTHERLASQPWAYNTLECYGCQNGGCQSYPAHSPCNFTKLELYSQGQLIEPVWKVNPKPSHDMECKEKPVVNSPSSVTIYFDYPDGSDE